jgi:hypothetical protein
VVRAINDLTMRLVTLILWYSPIGIFFLIAGQFAGVSYSVPILMKKKSGIDMIDDLKNLSIVRAESK